MWVDWTRTVGGLVQNTTNRPSVGDNYDVASRVPAPSEHTDGKWTANWHTTLTIDEAAI